jgi:hypothetical protein
MTLLHLLGDPIDSVLSMLLTLAMCQSRAARAKSKCAKAKIGLSDVEYDRTWKGLAIIAVSYDDCGKSEEAVKVYEE